MRTFFFFLLAVATCSAQAAPYPLGTMTCDDIGAFASQAMTWRKSHVTHDEAKLKLEEREYGESSRKESTVIRWRRRI
jgi:hypothetical protein